MTTNKLLWLSTIFTILNGGILCIILINSAETKIGYVYNDRLFSEYNAIEDQRGEYLNSIRDWESELAGLEQNVNEAIEVFKAEFQTLSDAERLGRNNRIEQMKRTYLQRKEEIEELKQAQDIKLSTSILKQIDTYIQEVGTAQGYDLIIGVTDAGNLLYGNDQNDITDVVLEGLNKKYEGS